MAILGMRGTGDWTEGQRPKSWRQQILYLYPNGMTPLTAMLSMMGSEKVPDAEFYWWTQVQNAVGGAVSGVYTLPDLSVSYTTGGVKGDVVYVTVATTLANRIRAGHQILLRDESDYRVDVVGKVTSLTRGSETSVLAVKLLEDDDNSPDNDLSDCDNFKIIGNINPEGGEMPDAISLNPTKIYNYTQIFRTPLSMTRTALRTKLRTPEQRQKAKAEALEMHSWEQELAFLWGVKTEETGDNGQPERSTLGAVNFIREYAATNCDDYTLNADFTGDAWTAGGETWFNEMMEKVARYGSGEKIALCGSGAMLGINALADAGAVTNISPGQKDYGLQITRYMTPFMTLNLKTHPLMSSDPVTRNMMIILEPRELKFMYIDDTTFYGESDSKDHPFGYGQRRIDGINEEFLTEAGLEFGMPQKCGILNGVGLDNTL